MSTSASPTTEYHEVTPSDYELLYQEQRQENERLKALLTVARVSGTPGNTQTSTRPVVTAERVEATLGRAAFLNTSRSEKLQAIGLDPSVTDEYLRKLFGRNADFKAAQDLHKTSPGKYALLREGAKILNIFAA